jgi:hypothetical protein
MSEEVRELKLPAKIEYDTAHHSLFLPRLQSRRERNLNSTSYRAVQMARNKAHDSKQMTHDHASLVRLKRAIDSLQVLKNFPKRTSKGKEHIRLYAEILRFSGKKWMAHRVPGST